MERNERLDDMLNECYSTITICGMEFSPADILAELDPVAYQCAVNDMEPEDDEE